MAGAKLGRPAKNTATAITIGHTTFTTAFYLMALLKEQPI